MDGTFVYFCVRVVTLWWFRFWPVCVQYGATSPSLPTSPHQQSSQFQWIVITYPIIAHFLQSDFSFTLVWLTQTNLRLFDGLNTRCSQEITSGWGVCQSQGETIGPAVPAARSGHSGGTGLVLRPAGDHPDASLCQRNGFQQGMSPTNDSAG